MQLLGAVLCGQTSTVILRRATDLDTDDIAAVHTAAFGATGELAAEARLVEDLRRDGDLIEPLSIVALIDDQVVGHVGCSYGALGGTPLVGLAPVGVLPKHQKHGVGSALMHAVLAAADALGEPGVVLLGDPGYYHRFGFERADEHGVMPPVVEWAEHFQLRRLTDWDLELRGAYRYAAAFDRI